MTFSTKRLVNSRIVVSGTDSVGTTGSVVLDSTQWDDINKVDRQVLADAAFADAVDTFFAPLLNAAEQAEAIAKVEDDPVSFIVFDEGTTGEAAKPRRVVHLNQASQVLRLIENNEDDRLVWVNGGLEILAAEAPAVPVVDPLQQAFTAAVESSEVPD